MANPAPTTSPASTGIPCASLSAISTTPSARITSAATTVCATGRLTTASPTSEVATKNVAAELPPPAEANA
ncbi:MAG: hypothetical protein JO016_20445 [Actinobacteria bacterium]|nr:hypothetical protein [Actinomycetota bacterium]